MGQEVAKNVETIQKAFEMRIYILLTMNIFIVFVTLTMNDKVIGFNKNFMLCRQHFRGKNFWKYLYLCLYALMLLLKFMHTNI